jgi:uncharacterized protein (DUF1800 family)
MPTARRDVAHLLRRVGFGGLPHEIDALTPLDWPEVVERVLDLSGAPSASVGLPDLNPTRGWWNRYVDMTFFWLERARTSPVPIIEKMVLFWHGLLCSGLDKVSDHQMMFDQNQLFRTHGLGDVVELYQRMAVQPAMLRYLDGDRNVNGAPNENFSRELMELFTLGAGRFTQDDVVAGARAWTGHNLDGAGRYVFRADRHDTGQKTFFGVTRNWDGPEIISHLLAGPKRDESARFIAAKLWSFLAYPNPEPEVVSEVGGAFTRSGMNVAALVRAILLHPGFRSERARTGLVRSPIEFVVSAMRHTGQPCSVAHPEWWLKGMGQEPYEPPNISGWRQNGYWISPSALWAKAGFASHLRWKCDPTDLLADSRRLSVERAVDDALGLFGIDEPSPPTLDALRNYVRSGRASPDAWAERSGLLLLPMLTPEFQLA